MRTNQKTLKEEPKEFLAAKFQYLKRMKLDTIRDVNQKIAKLVEVPYAVSPATHCRRKESLYDNCTAHTVLGTKSKESYNKFAL